MKLNWFSPLPPASSDIANYTMRLLPHLAEKAEILLWTNQATWSSEIEKYGKVCPYQLEPIPWPDLHQGDLNIYNLGNNAEFHKDIWQMSRQCSGLVILHDYKLQHFFSGIYQNNKAEYLTQMERYYGKEGRQMAQLFLKNSLSVEWMADSYPLTSLALENAIGVITHSQWVYEQLSQENQWITALMPLPYYSSVEMMPQPSSSIQPPYQLIMFGYLGTNRCLDIILKALATFPEKEQFTLAIYGQIDPANHVHRQIQELGLEKLVKIQGFVPEEDLNLALSKAHLALNLRYPTMGEASGSQLRIWSQGLPSLVTQIGWYAALPKDTMAFVRPHHEIEDIHDHLKSFCQNPNFYQRIGQKGQDTLRKLHHPQQYAEALLELSQQVQKYRYRPLVNQLTQRVGQAMSLWYSPSQREFDCAHVAEAIRFYTH